MPGDYESARAGCPRAGHRALKALILLSFAAALGITAFGCSGEFSSPNAQSYDPAENALIEAHLAERGYDASNLEFEGDMVIVEGDMVMQREMLLDQAEAAASGVVEKGYFNANTRLFEGNRIQVSFAVDVSDTWRTAFNAAVAEWNNKTPRFATSGAPGSPRTIGVRMGSINVTQPARADGIGAPALGIQLNSRYNLASCSTTLEGIPAAQKTNIALHEIGHILGFEHPPPLVTGGILIPATTASTGTSTVSYSTVMDSRCLPLNVLSSDDIQSASIKYPAPSCQAICENNSLSQIDPGAIGLCIASCPQQCGG